jgi:hypothetical protein
MKDIFIIEGKKYISSRRASEMSDYSSDYIGQLCRANKLDCKMVGRTWFVTEESIHLHKALISREEVGRNRINNLKGKSENYISIKKAQAQSSVSIKTITESPKITDESAMVPVSKSSTDSTIVPPVKVAEVVENKISPIIPPIKWNIVTETKGIVSPYIYSNDNRPLLPELKKKETIGTVSGVVEIKKQEVSKKVQKEVFAVSVPTVSTPAISTSSVSEKKPLVAKPVISSTTPTKSISESLIVKNSISYLKLTRQIILQRVIAPALVLIVMFGVGTGTYIVADKIEDNISPELADSAKMVTANIYDAVGSALLTMKNGYNNVVAFFTSPAKLAMDVPREFGEVTVSKVTPNGIVLSSSVGSEQGDEELKNKIKGSFSDDVEISPDNSGTAGVITPVFKDTKGKDFVYVMVPVKEKDNKVTQ